MGCNRGNLALMKIHGMCLVKNEADIVEYSLTENAKWCDFVYVFDTGSTDETWAIVQRLAEKNPRIIPFRHEPRAFDDALRSEIFNQQRGFATSGDWWCRLDTDEIYIDNPKEFLPTIHPAHHVVWSHSVQYYFTEKDLERFPDNAEGPPPVVDASNLPRHYVADDSEARFFRHRPRLRWDTTASWPAHMGLVSPKRIRIKHYQYRSPAQIQMRLDTRRQAAESGWKHFPHALETDWRKKIAKSDNLTLDMGDGHYILDESRLPNHLESKRIRIIKRLLHGAGIWP